MQSTRILRKTVNAIGQNRERVSVLLNKDSQSHRIVQNQPLANTAGQSPSIKEQTGRQMQYPVLREPPQGPRIKEANFLFVEKKVTNKQTKTIEPVFGCDKTSDEVMDSVTKAKLEREKQGTYESEVSYGGEADLHKHYRSCTKNPEHTQFVPLDDFNEKHLPPGYQKYGLVNLVRIISYLTVRVTVTHVSKERPEFYPGSDLQYPSYSKRGEHLMRTGTGWVGNVLKYSHRYFCECSECLKSKTPKRGGAVIHILTAAHLVFDSDEGSHTTCHLFFDREDTVEACVGVVPLQGMSKVYTNINEDWCVMVYFTHDMALINDLQRTLNHGKDMFRRLKNPWVKKPPTSHNLLSWNKLTIIVSHPHGCSKHVSLGYYVGDLETMNEGWFLPRTTYSAATCAGSSGAFVLILGSLFEKDWSEYGWGYGYIHSGYCENNPKLSYGICSIFYL